LLYGHYEKTLDGDSAYEMLKQRAAKAPSAASVRRRGEDASDQGGSGGFIKDILGTVIGGRRARRTDSIVESMAKSAARSFGTQLGRQVLRGVLGSLSGSSRRG
jgi:hypothetical protein